MQQAAAAAGMPTQQFMPPQMFYAPGQQPGFPPNMRGQMPFPNMPGAQGGRGSGFPGMPPQQGGRGGPMAGPGMPPMFGMPPNMPPGAFGAAPYGANPAYLQQLAQAQAAAMGGRGGAQRGNMPMMGLPPQMGMPAMRGSQNFPQGGRGGAQGRQYGGYPGARGMPPQMGGMGQPVAAGIDIESLSQAPAAQQKQMLGEALYPKIHEQNPELAGKITGMLLEMDNSELLTL